jgi:hypothetical protein
LPDRTCNNAIEITRVQDALYPNSGIGGLIDVTIQRAGRSGVKVAALTAGAFVACSFLAGCGSDGSYKANAAAATPEQTDVVAVSDQDVRDVCVGAAPGQVAGELPGPATRLLPEGASSFAVCTTAGTDEGFRENVARVVTDTAAVSAVVHSFNDLTTEAAEQQCPTSGKLYRAVFFSRSAPAVALTVDPGCATASNGTTSRASVDSADSAVTTAISGDGVRRVELYPATAGQATATP